MSIKIALILWFLSLHRLVLLSSIKTSAATFEMHLDFYRLITFSVSLHFCRDKILLEALFYPERSNLNWWQLLAGLLASGFIFPTSPTALSVRNICINPLEKHKLLLSDSEKNIKFQRCKNKFKWIWLLSLSTINYRNMFNKTTPETRPQKNGNRLMALNEN